MAVYFAAKNPESKVDKLTHFALYEHCRKGEHRPVKAPYERLLLKAFAFLDRHYLSFSSSKYASSDSLHACQRPPICNLSYNVLLFGAPKC
jgi:hypothetical protein